MTKKLARTCTIDCCDLPEAHRGWCRRHYQLSLKHGELPITLNYVNDGCHFTHMGSDAIRGEYGEANIIMGNHFDGNGSWVGEERADDRHEQHPAAHPGEHRDDAHEKSQREERDRPDPPLHQE